MLAYSGYESREANGRRGARTRAESANGPPYPRRADAQRGRERPETRARVAREPFGSGLQGGLRGRLDGRNAGGDPGPLRTRRPHPAGAPGRGGAVRWPLDGRDDGYRAVLQRERVHLCDGRGLAAPSPEGA